MYVCPVVSAADKVSDCIGAGCPYNTACLLQKAREFAELKSDIVYCISLLKPAPLSYLDVCGAELDAVINSGNYEESDDGDPVCDAIED